MDKAKNTGKTYFVLGTILIGIIILSLFKIIGYENTWRLWQVPTMMPPFADLRLIPGGAETFRRGLDPTIKNPGDPYGRIFNYPRIWYLFFYTGISQNDVLWLGVFIFALFYIGLITFPGKLNWRGSILMLLITFSPAAMLLYERGNVDLLIFFICAMAIITLDYSALGAALIILFGSLLKIFPIFGLGILLSKKIKQVLCYSFLVVVSFGIYAGLTFDNIQASWDLTMRGKTISYGTNIIFFRYRDFFLKILANVFPEPLANIILIRLPYLLGLTIVFAVVLIGLKNSLINTTDDPKNLAAFRMGAFIYAGTFLLGNNWDYRLTFLLFTIPQLANWLEIKNNRSRILALITISLIVISCWHFILLHWFSLSDISSEIPIIFDEVANWGLFALLSYLLIVTLPEWFQAIIKNPVQILRLLKEQH